LAAGEFAKAAAGTSNEEALRTLRLLEQHHQKMSQLLKFPVENPVVDSTSEKTVTASAAVSELRTAKDIVVPSSRRTPANAPTNQIPRRMPPREMSSSIASNLASARGIRSSNTRRALSPSFSTHQAPGSLEIPSRKNTRHPTSQEVNVPENMATRPSWVPPMPGNQPKADARVTTTRASAVAKQEPPSTIEDGFHGFYSTFENLLSKLSAPLAFAGLPLVAEEPPTTSTATGTPTLKSRSSTNTRPTTEPDLTKYISRAALRASAHPAPGNESFYVVPSTGHTVSYAGILSFAEKEKRRMAASIHAENPDLFDDPDDDDFVDAHETPEPPSPGLIKRLGGSRSRARGGQDLENVVEELYMENKSLKDCVDKLSRRLQAFEMSAQSSSLALQESMRMMRPSSPSVIPPYIPTGGSDNEMKSAARISMLEERVATNEEEIQKLRKENEKLKDVLGKYRERWEKLKEGAKTRREVGGKDSLGGPGRDGDGGRYITG
jgi:regulator of replication initiation timing